MKKCVKTTPKTIALKKEQTGRRHGDKLILSIIAKKDELPTVEETTELDQYIDRFVDIKIDIDLYRNRNI